MTIKHRIVSKMISVNIKKSIIWMKYFMKDALT